MLSYHRRRHLRRYASVGLLLAVMMSPGCRLGIYTTDCKGLLPCTQSAECTALKPHRPSATFHITHAAPLTYWEEHCFLYRLSGVC